MEFMVGWLRRIIWGEQQSDQAALAKEGLKLQRHGVRLAQKGIRLSWLVVFLTLASLAGTAWAINIAMQAQASTEVVTLRPFGSQAAGDEVVGVVTAIREGMCWTDAFASSRGDSFRCIDETNLIWDPCFAHWQGYKVACPDDPTRPSYIVLTLTEPVDWESEDRRSVNGPNPYFTIRTKSGLVCDMQAGGTAPLLAGVEVNYFCDGDREAHTLRITSGPWTIVVVDAARGIDRSEEVLEAYR